MDEKSTKHMVFTRKTSYFDLSRFKLYFFLGQIYTLFIFPCVITDTTLQTSIYPFKMTRTQIILQILPRL